MIASSLKKIKAVSGRGSSEQKQFGGRVLRKSLQRRHLSRDASGRTSQRKDTRSTKIPSQQGELVLRCDYQITTKILKIE